MDLGGYAAVVPASRMRARCSCASSARDDEEVMPPPKKGKRSPPEQADLIRRWIAQGGKYEKHWSYNPPVKHEVPAAAGRHLPVNEIDRSSSPGSRRKAQAFPPRPTATPWPAGFRSISPVCQPAVERGRGLREGCLARCV